MAKSIIVEGKTSTEAIEKGLKELKVSKDKVDIKILENEEKRSFFSILAPRVVKVEMTLKDGVTEKKAENKPREEVKHIEKEKRAPLKPEELEKAKLNLQAFLKDFVSKVNNMEYKVSSDDEYVYVTLNGEDAGKLIGYRGETLNSMQAILTAIANKQVESRVHLVLDIEGYRAKRQKALEELADKLTRTVINTGKQVTLEPMSAYERKIIHNTITDFPTDKYSEGRVQGQMKTKFLNLTTPSRILYSTNIAKGKTV